MNDIEHAGDSARGRLVHELSHVLVTPFDREDMFRLSRAIDDILDNLRDFVRELDLLAVTDPLFDPVVDELTKALDLLRDAIARIGSAPREVPDRALRAKKAGNRVRRTYQEAIAELLSGDVTVGMLRRRELLRRLDVVGLRLSDAVDTLADGAIKRTN